MCETTKERNQFKQGNSRLVSVICLTIENYDKKIAPFLET